MLNKARNLKERKHRAVFGPYRIFLATSLNAHPAKSDS